VLKNGHPNDYDTQAAFDGGWIVTDVLTYLPFFEESQLIEWFSDKNERCWTRGYNASVDANHLGLQLYPCVQYTNSEESKQPYKIIRFPVYASMSVLY